MSLADIISVEGILTFLLIVFRLAGLFLAAPMLSNRSVPAPVKVAFCLMVSTIIFPNVSYSNPEAITSDLLIAQLALQEVLIGVFLGFAANVLFTAVQMAGEFFGVKVGFAIATIVDPANQGAAGILTSVYIVIASLLFLFLNGHHLMIGALLESYSILPIGQGFDLSSAAARLPELMSHILVIAIKMTAPVLIVLTLLSFVFGFVTKLSPQMNVYFNVGFVLAPMLGFVTMLLTLPLFRILMTDLTGSFEPELMNLIYQLKGAKGG